MSDESICLTLMGYGEGNQHYTCPLLASKLFLASKVFHAILPNLFIKILEIM